MLNYFMEFYLLIYLFSAVIFLLSLPIACGCIYLDIFQSPDVCYQKDLPTFSIPSSREFHLRMAGEWLFSISEAITPFRSKDLGLRLKSETFFILFPPQNQFYHQGEKRKMLGDKDVLYVNLGRGQGITQAPLSSS